MAKQAKPEPTKQEPASKTKVVKGEVEKAVPARALSPFEEMDRMMESFFPRGWMRPFRWELPHWPELRELRMPKVDVIDRADQVVVKAEVPGVDKKDLEVSMTENTVTIKGKTSHEEKEEKGDYYRCEISRGAFTRTVALPSDIDTAKAKASFRDGILELTIPKVEKSKRRMISVD
jgi:HSP20 family protein